MTKNIYILAITFFTIQIGIVNAQSYTLDVSTSRLQWTGYAEAGGYSQSGTLRYQSGNVSIVKGEISNFTIAVDMTSLTHENKELEGHLKQNDFFFVSKYPIAQLKFIEKKRTTCIVEVTIRGKTEQVEITLNLKKLKEGYLVKGKMKLDRTKFDIKYNSSSYFQDLGNYAIKNDFDLEYELFFKKM